MKERQVRSSIAGESKSGDFFVRSVALGISALAAVPHVYAIIYGARHGSALAVSLAVAIVAILVGIGIVAWRGRVVPALAAIPLALLSLVLLVLYGV